MKSITLRLNLEDKEVLEAEIYSLLVDTAKQISREQFQAMLEKEIERIVDARIKDVLSPSWWGQREIKNQIKAHLDRYLSDQDLYNQELCQAREELLEELNRKTNESILKLGNNVDSYINGLNAQISREISARVNALLHNEIAKTLLTNIYSTTDDNKENTNEDD